MQEKNKLYNLKRHKNTKRKAISTWRVKFQKLVTFENDLCPLFSAYFQNYSKHISQILAQEIRHANSHFSFRKHFKIKFEKMCKRTSKMVHVQIFKTGHRPWPLVEEMFITFEPPTRILRSLYRWNRIEISKNATWAK